MNGIQQTKKGFKTFVITLVVALIAFSFLYYFISDSSSEINYVETIKKNDSASNQITTNTNKSAFEDLSKQRLEVPRRAVLSDADISVTAGGSTKPATTLATTKQTTQSTTAPVPNGGSTEMTLALVISTIALTIGGYMLFLGPRRMAIESFERGILKDLD